MKFFKLDQNQVGEEAGGESGRARLEQGRSVVKIFRTSVQTFIYLTILTRQCYQDRVAYQGWIQFYKKGFPQTWHE